MKKVILSFVAVIIMLLSLSVSADYASYYDVIGDFKLLLGADPDAAWTMTDDAVKNTAGSLEGYVCRDNGEATVCEKSHWTGEYRFTLYFNEGTLSAIECLLTGPTIQDLNYSSNTAYVQPAVDLINRLTSAGLISAGAQETEADLFPNDAITPHGSAYATGSNSLMQVGFKSKTDSDPVFRLAFIAASVSFAEQAGSGAITMPVSADETTDIGTNEPGKAEISITPSEISVNDEFTILITAPGADGVRLWNGKSKELVQEIPLAGFDTFQFSVQSFVPGTAIFYITTLHNGIWSDEPDSTAKVVTKAPMNYQGINVISAKSEEEFLGIWQSTRAGMNDGNGNYNIFNMNLDQKTQFTFSKGKLTVNIDDEETTYDTRFEDGILFSKTGAFELTENGYMTWPQSTGMVVYLEKISNSVPEETGVSPTDSTHNVILSSTAYEVPVNERYTVTISAPGAKSVQLIDIDHGNIVVEEKASENLDIVLSSGGPGIFHFVGLAFFDGFEEGIRSNEIYVTVSDNVISEQTQDSGQEHKVTLTVSDHVIETGVTLKISASAPGADGIRICAGDWDYVYKEGTGDSLDYYIVEINAAPEASYYAVASYDGVWSDQRSDLETVQIVPSTLLRFTSPDTVHSGETFKLGIYEFENTSAYNVRITDNEGSLVREQQVRDGYTDMAPLTAGSFKLTVNCIGNEAHSLTTDLLVSDDQPTSGLTKKEETPSAGDVSQTQNNTSASAGEHKVILTASAEAVGLNEDVRFDISAPGAVSVRLLRDGEILDEFPGDSYAAIFRSTEPTNYNMAAEAIFSDSEEPVRSNEVYVTVADKADPGQEPASPLIGSWFLENYYTVKDDGSPMAVMNARSGMWKLFFNFDAMYLLINEDGTFEQVSYLNYESSASAGTWTQDPNDGSIVLDGDAAKLYNGEILDSCQVEGDDLICSIYNDGKLFAKMQLHHSELSEEEMENARNSLQILIDALQNYQSGESSDGRSDGQTNESDSTGEQTSDTLSGLQTAAADSLNALNMGNAYFYGNGVKKDAEQAAYWWEQAADLGNPQAMGSLAYLYYTGNGVPQDYDKAFIWSQKAADAGDKNGCFYLGAAYFFGNGAETDQTQGVYWWEKAAELGDLVAQRNTGLAYSRGNGVEQNAEKAAEWWKKAAELGDAESQYLLADAYRTGTGIEQDNDQASFWYEKSAEQDYALAQYYLAVYYSGQGNEEQTVKWMQKAAENGNADAQYLIGYFYYLGAGVEKDLVKAAYWLQKAADQGQTAAVELLREIPDDIKEAAAFPAADVPDNSANDPVLGGWKLYSYTSLVDGQPDMPNCFFENDNNFRNSPLRADRLELIFIGNKVYKALILDGKISVETGTWKKENSDYYITYDSGETEGPYYLIDDNGLAIKIPGEGNKATHLQFNRMEMTEEKYNEILTAHE